MHTPCFLSSALHSLGSLGWRLHDHHPDGYDGLSPRDLVTIEVARGEFPGGWHIQTECDGNGGICKIMLLPDTDRRLPAFELAACDGVIMVRITRGPDHPKPEALVFGVFQSVVAATYAIHNEVITCSERVNAEVVPP